MTFQSNGPVGNENYSIATGANSTSPFITVFMTRDPNSFDAQYSVKQRWINTVTASEWILTGFSNQTGQTLAIWLEIGGGEIQGTWIPTLDGSTPGTTVYIAQLGLYVKTRYLVQAQFRLVISSATGTGTLRIGNLPFPIKNVANVNVAGTVNLITALTWPMGTTSIALLGQPASPFLTIWCSGSATAGSEMSMANTLMDIQGTIVYEF